MPALIFVANIVAGIVGGIAVSFLVKEMAVDHGQFVHRDVVYVVEARE